ncbi:MAG TPA: hypothetical protein VNJ04_02795 [Gemmatimonadaceae bacterium]|nr:hypothetical protein [Gemmatimonadaceae bacterium]
MADTKETTETTHTQHETVTTPTPAPAVVKPSEQVTTQQTERTSTVTSQPKP